jgi:hypothetical protein
VTPEGARFLEKARTLLDHADIMLSVKLNDDAGRNAYLAGFTLHKLSSSNTWEKHSRHTKASRQNSCA